MIRSCIGCGIKLQSINKGELGFIPEDKFDKSKFCQRCFRLSNYSDLKEASLNKDNADIIKTVNKKSELSFYLVDFLNINSETIEMFKKITTDKVLVISKIDILPKSIKKQLIINWLKDDWDIKEEIILLSSNKNYAINSIINTMDKKKKRVAYLLGYTNAGKSTLINKILEKYKNEVGKITTSNLPNTTLDFIRIPIDELTIVDSPGFVMKNNFYELNESDLIKRLNYKNIINPVTYQVKSGTSILIEERLRVISADDNSWTIYANNNLNLRKVYEKNETCMDKDSKVLELADDSDIVIKGIGFINVKKACKIIIYLDLLELVEVRESFFRSMGE